jgi:hypothetical protein
MEPTNGNEMTHRVGKPSLNPAALISFLGRCLTILGAAVNGALVVLGDGLGIYRALADIGPATSQKLAAKTNLSERLSGQHKRALDTGLRVDERDWRIPIEPRSKFKVTSFLSRDLTFNNF